MAAAYKPRIPIRAPKSGMLDEQDTAAARETAPALRDEAGAIRPDFVETVAEAVGGRDAGLLRALVGELHEADTGDLIEALDADLRPQLIELMGKDFDFTALTEVDDTVREEILEELEPETVAEGVRDLDSDDAVYILEDLPKEDQAEILEQTAAERARRAGAAPRLPGGVRRAADADRVHRGAAELDRRSGDRLHARDRGSAGAVLRILRGRSRSPSCSARCRSTGCCAPSGRCGCPS